MEAENIQKCMAIQATLSGKNLEVTPPPLYPSCLSLDSDWLSLPPLATDTEFQSFYR